MEPIEKQLVRGIIEEQEVIIGPVAWDEARSVSGLEIDEDHQINIKNNIKDVLDSLVSTYEQLFGPASREVCKEAVRRHLPDIANEKIPDSLK